MMMMTMMTTSSIIPDLKFLQYLPLAQKYFLEQYELQVQSIVLSIKTMSLQVVWIMFDLHEDHPHITQLCIINQTK